MNPIRPIAALSSLVITFSLFQGVISLARPTHAAAQERTTAHSGLPNMMARVDVVTAKFTQQ